MSGAWTEALTPCVVPATMGVIAHGIFKRKEPTINTFAVSTIAVYAALYSLCQRDPGLKVAPDLDLALNAALTLGVYLVTLSTSIVLYRTVWPGHPLYGVPGPFLARVSQWWLLRLAYIGQLRHNMKELHERYGEVVRIGPNEVSVNNAAAVLQITGGKSWQKGNSYDTSASGAGQKETSLISLRDHPEHTTRRRLWDKAFSLSALEGYQPLIYARLEDLMEQLKARQGKPVDLHHWLGFFVYDAMTDLAYGGGGDFTKSGTDNGILHELSVMFDHSGMVKVIPWTRPLSELLPAAKVAVQFRAFAKTLFMKRLGADRTGMNADIFHFLTGEWFQAGSDEGKDPPPKLSVKELAADSVLVIAAGADTTRTVLTSIFLFMLRQPKRFAELQAVLDAAIGSDPTPSHSILVKIPLLDAYINEALRLNPPLPFHIQRVVPEGGAEVGGRYLPEGTQARLAIYAIHRDPRFYTRPDEFLPERWMPGSKLETMDKRAFLPFIHGPYHCPGKQFAYQEMRILLATIISSFNMTLEPGFDTIAFEKSWEDRTITDIQQPFRVILTPREAKA